jgi:predicted nucleotidyltransferase
MEPGSREMQSTFIRVCLRRNCRLASLRGTILRGGVMIELIEKNRPALEELCRRFHVKTLEVFGSAADGTFDPERSDLDFLVEFLPAARTRIFDGYFHLKDALEQMFGRKVDLVMPGAIRNPYFRKAVNQQRKVLYAA